MMKNAKAAWALLRDSASLWLESNAFQQAGALAFYTLFSLAPIVIISVSVAGLIFGQEAARGEISQQIEGLVGPESAQAVEQAVAESRPEIAGIIPTLTGIVALLVGATTVFAQMQQSLNQIWGVVAKPSKSGLIIFLRSRLLSLALVLVIGFLLLVSLLLSVVVRGLIRFAGDWIPFSAVAVTGIEFLLSFVVITLLFAMIFKILPDVEISWRDVWTGAALTTIFFILGRWLISTYLAYTATASTYGAAGSLVLVLLWVYYSSLILFFGAAFTRVHARSRGHPVIPRNLAVLVRHEIIEEPRASDSEQLEQAEKEQG